MATKHIFSWLLKKAIFMALWMKAVICDKARFASKYCQEHQAGQIRVNPCKSVVNNSLNSCKFMADQYAIRKTSYEKFTLFEKTNPILEKSSLA